MLSNYQINRPIADFANDDDIYYNVLITNSQNSNTTYTQATVTESRTVPIINNPSEYYLTVTRFSIPGYDLPLFIFPIDTSLGASGPTGVTGANTSNLSVSLSYNGVTLQQPLYYNTTLPFISTPLAPSQNPPSYQQVDSPYYYIYEYQPMIDMMNTALATCFALFDGSGATGHGPTAPAGSQAPFFVYDTTTQLISLVAQQNFYDLALGSTAIKVFVNTKLYKYITGIHVIGRGDAVAAGANFQINIENDHNNVVSGVAAPTGPYSPGTSGNYLVLTQEFNTLANWNSLQSLVLLTNTLPTRKEFIPAQNLNLITSNNSTNNFQSILTDFVPTLEKAGDSRSTFTYYVTGPYRLINLLGSAPLYNVDISIYWADNNNVLRPLYLAQGSTCSIKLLFIKKSSYSHTI